MKKTISFTCFIVAFLFSARSFSQNTIGLQYINDSLTYGGYNLIFPHNQANVYLLDQCGQVVHTWTDEEIYQPGNAVYLLENGNLVKCKRLFNAPVTDPIWAGGGGDIVEIRSWENDLLDSFKLNNEFFRLHHDVAPMPNGHILLLSWEKKTYEEAVKAGRDTSLLPQNELWPDAVFEWAPELDSIVWEWHIWDHLIQDYDATKDNFGEVAAHPELVNINYDEADGHPDWLHTNAISYNPVLDQFILSIPHFNEFWVIDHSTTTEEAKGHSGGRSGKGGDILYRWGNPATYDRGMLADKKSFFQHDVRWVDPNASPADSNYARIAFFNNQYQNTHSVGHIITPGWNNHSSSYSLVNNTFGPTDFTLAYVHPTGETKASSNSLSSFQVLPNGNVLLLAGRWGFAYELTREGKLAWEYIIPIKGGRPATQGDSLQLNNNITFRMARYGTEYPAFIEKDLSPIGYLELNANEELCKSFTVSIDQLPLEINTINAFPNPFSDLFHIEWNGEKTGTLILYDSFGRQIKTIILNNGITEVDTASLSPGLYFLKTNQGQSIKIIKN